MKSPNPSVSNLKLVVIVKCFDVGAAKLVGVPGKVGGKSAGESLAAYLEAGSRSTKAYPFFSKYISWFILSCIPFNQLKKIKGLLSFYTTD